MITLPQTDNVISAEAKDLISIDLTKYLDASETISSVDNVAVAEGSGLTLENEAVKALEWPHKKGHTVAANKGVQVWVTAGTTTGAFHVQWSITTSLARTPKFQSRISVV